MSTELLRLGWREWLALPDLGIPALKAKIDSGARSSALHVDRLQLLRQGGRQVARFTVHPGSGLAEIEVEADVIDIRPVTDSGGRVSRRPFIRTMVDLAGRRWPIEMNLTSRSNMLFPMLLGRTAMAGRLLVDPAASYLFGKPVSP